MLKLINITKDYPMKDQEPVHALKGLTLNFRRHEFVSILGPSGCGKTTLLNIIGGLDRYTSGDLIIAGKSTKDYKDGDWDTYRNHSIGFVFQTYNLIPHQSIIKNVELALTIAGVDKEERRKRALRALEKVGLGGLEKKKPNQLSGGQMQRVAIARALINEPEILLADEPTGALDSETSIQVMDLLKEVAKDCLVIMVTHNPDLANAYSSRIVKMKDGLILSDSNPLSDKEEALSVSGEERGLGEIYTLDEIKTYIRSYAKRYFLNEDVPLTTEDTTISGPVFIQGFDKGILNSEDAKVDAVSVASLNKEKEQQVEQIKTGKSDKVIKKDKVEETTPTINKGKKKRSSMSFFTALGLSLSNLLSKFKRTLLIAIAGSIGIIGVSAVLAVSTGVHNYINKMQNDMISQYPIGIAETAVDYTSLLTGLSNDDQKKIVDFAKEYEVGLDSLITYLMDKYQDFTSVKTNDINDDLIEYVESIDPQYVASINKNYGLDMTNNIFAQWNREKDAPETYISLNGLTQMYISELQTVEGFSEYAVFVDLFTDFMKQLPAEEDYILEQYDILAGSYPKSANDIVLVVDTNQTLTDLIYAQMGFFTENEFINIARKAIYEHDGNISPEELAKYDYPTSYTFDQILGKKLKYYPHDSIWEYKVNSYDFATFSMTIPYNGVNYEAKFSFQYIDKVDSLKGTIDIEGTSLDISFYRKEGTVDYANPFKGEWTGSLLNSPITFTVTDTNVIIHFLINTTYELDGNNISFNINASTGPASSNLTYDSGSDTLIGTFTSSGMDIPVVFNRVSGTSGTSYLGSWTALIGGMIPLTFDLKENNVLTFHYDINSTYEITPKEVKGYMYEANVQDDWVNGEDVHIAAILKKKDTVNFGCLGRGVYYTKELTQKMMRDAKDSDIVSGYKGIEDYIGSSFEDDKAYQAYVTYTYTSYAKGDGDLSIKDVAGYANALNTDLSSSLSSLISIRGTMNFDLDKAYLRSLSGLATKQQPDGTITYESLPQRISIYPKDFTTKKHITDYLKKWNSLEDITLSSGKVLKADDRQELTYEDTVEIIINVINTLINVITVALISFTSLALIVSCFMIAVITYISTMERVKEIGVIRSLGGRKKDVSRLFIAETLIIGFASGVIGIGVTYLLQIILNAIIASFNVGVTNIAALPFFVALIMIALSIFLNVISGLIPSMKASNQDPVAALRSE